ncbi:tetratricopeptide repeat protein [Spirosoma sp. KUDC1026]|uniref:tetratricopeptide repeat protein n=1 Tax=Spirosoma sp. KUDC1026 TaxID=2745947 RepID=UPI00159BB61B|nr:tetratricopeptide repeat protein [Spirosoma sp. KUDC1026]QKZ14828.1 tetratricopeptide repeat protein [Spirosoma sp. KUDC1026]
MKPILEQIIHQAKQLFEEKKYQEIINLLNDDCLIQYTNAALYAWRARAHARLNETEAAFSYAQKSIDIDPQLAISYLSRGNAWYGKSEYNKAISDYTEAIRLDSSEAYAFGNRGLAWYGKKEYNKAISDYTEAIRLDPKANRYVNRGLVWAEKGEYDKAISDYTEAIRLDSSEAYAFGNRGLAWYGKKEYNKAISDYTEAIRLDPKATFYNNRGNAWAEKGEYDKAISDYTEAIRLDSNESYAFYNRAITWSSKKEYQKAIADYERYVSLTNNSDDYYTQVSLSSISELKKRIENAWYDEIDSIVNKIKRLLLFENTCLTHYTSLSGARSMILGNSPFRLSEGAFLNDTSEGRELFNYLSYGISKFSADETMAKLFVERPFIGSFVADNKHNDLTLWRMYGKEALAEAKGCALTIYKREFVDNLKEQISPTGTKSEVQSQDEEQFTFYNVAYLSKNSFIIPGKKKSTEKQLNLLMNELKSKVKNLSENQKNSVTNLLNDIAYLFKSSEYQYENEVRLVVQGVGFTKKIEKEENPPKVYIELVDIVPSIKKITLGPKVERPDEWAAAFNYHIKDQLKSGGENIEIVISHLPFK